MRTPTTCHGDGDRDHWLIACVSSFAHTRYVICHRRGLKLTRGEAIETYNEGLDPIKSFMRWERELPQFIRKLRNQHVHYAQTIRILLEPITSDVELGELMTDPGSLHLWGSPKFATKLQDRLQESFVAYQNTIADIERITKAIALKLDLDRSKEVDSA